MSDGIAGTILGLALLACFVLIFWVGLALAFVAAIPVIALVLACKLGVNAYNAPHREEARAMKVLEFMYEEAKRRVQPITKMDFGRGVRDALPATETIPEDLFDAFMYATFDMYDQERFDEGLPPPPVHASGVERARYKDELPKCVARLSRPKIAIEGISRAFREFLNALPSHHGTRGLSVRLSSVSNVDYLVETLAANFFTRELQALDLFHDLTERLRRNMHHASGLPYDARVDSPKALLPTAYRGDDVVNAYLRDTPLQQIFDVDIPFAIPPSTEGRHVHFLAPTDRGKTTAYRYLILEDFKKVETGKHSVIVLDGKGPLIRGLRKHPSFAPGSALDNRLIVIDPNDVKHPIPLAPFAMGRERLSTYLDKDQERLENSVIELLTYMLGSLKGAVMTPQQQMLFSFGARLLATIPDATITSFQDLLLPKGEERFRDSIDALTDETARKFFKTTFIDPAFAHTRKEVTNRLLMMMESKSFGRFLDQPSSKLDLFTEINAGKVILVNADKSLLRNGGTGMLGRYFIALVAQAAQERMLLPKAQRIPVTFYIDEFADYAGEDDEYITSILQTAREANVSIIVAHQKLGDLAHKTAESLSYNTAIKFFAGIPYSDSSRFARDLRTAPEFISSQPKGSFACFVRDFTPAAVSIRFPLVDIPKMTDDQWIQTRQAIRNRYAASSTAVAAAEPVDITSELETDIDTNPA